ncbi:MAG: ParB/RepB/Spo0J family partition protein [Firmicutes bacterium]|nr:ParB/RepB/Spo0J family partition protein [Bacillota bacterium]
MPKRGLGRGLEALIPEAGAEDGDEPLEIAVADIMPNALQPRRRFDDEKMQELVQSIREHGVVQPVLVRRRGYELVAGERRWRAAQAAGLRSIPAVVRELSDADAMQVALIENLQREDLNPMEEAEAFDRLTREFNLTQEEIANRVGKSRPHVANTVRLLQLHKSVQDLVRSGALAMGHARALLGLHGAEQVKAAQVAVAKGLSARGVEALVRRMAGAGRTKRTGPTARAAELVEAEDRLREALGTRVRIEGSEKKGRIEIMFYGPEDLQRIVEALVRPTREAAAGRAE